MALDILLYFNVDITIWIQQMITRKTYGQSILIVDIFEVRTLVRGEVLIESFIMALVYSYRMWFGQSILLVHSGARSWNHPTKVHQLE